MDFKEYRDNFMKQYGHQLVIFYSYYKYTFCFKNKDIAVYVGGSHDDIYRLSVTSGKEYTVEELDPTSAYVKGEKIYSLDW